jgi:uncharacterized phage-associated protein
LQAAEMGVKRSPTSFWTITARLVAVAAASLARWRKPGAGNSGVFMATVFDVAAYILARKGEITAWKLQKLVYYSQAWSLVWDERPLFRERIEAWANGPVCPELYAAHRGAFVVLQIRQGNEGRLDADARETIDAVLSYYGDKSSQWLSDLTHREPPWRDAREGFSDGERGNAEISHGAMADYYGSL